MEVKITRSAKTAKWTLEFNKEQVVSPQGSLWKLFQKAYKYFKSQGL